MNAFLFIRIYFSYFLSLASKDYISLLKNGYL